MRGIDWNYRMRRLAYRLVVRLMRLRFGEERVGYWLWNLTCFPFDIPSWDQIWRAVLLIDGSLSWVRAHEQTEDIMLGQCERQIQRDSEIGDGEEEQEEGGAAQSLLDGR